MKGVWHTEFALRILPELLRGLVVTLEAAVAGMALALALGLVWTIAKRAPNRTVSWPVRGLVEFVRRTPLLVQLFFIFYTLPLIGLTLPPLAAGILALGLHYSTYTSEVYRAGIEGVPRGQWEAAAALNLTPWQTWRNVVLPQAIPPVIPALANYWIALLKDTPMLSAITVLEVLQRAQLIGKETFRYFEPLTIVGAMYLVLAFVSGVAVRRLEQRYGTVEGAR